MSTIATNTITNVAGNATGVGIAVSNAATYNSDGGNVSQNLVQAVAKVWHRLGNGTGTIVTRDSFNVSSIADNGTGLYRITINNNMSNVLYGIVQGELDWRTTGVGSEGNITSTHYNLTSRAPSNAAFLDSETHTSSALGDLA